MIYLIILILLVCVTNLVLVVGIAGSVATLLIRLEPHVPQISKKPSNWDGMTPGPTHWDGMPTIPPPPPPRKK